MPVQKRKGPYSTLPQRDVQHVQVAHLKHRFELAQDSFLAQQVAILTNSALDEHEAKGGIRRVKPGELYVRRGEEDLLLPLLSYPWATALAEGFSPRTVKRHLELEQYLILQKVDKTATLEDIWKLTDQGELARKSAPKGFEYLPETPLNTEKMVHLHLQKEAVVPAEVFKELVEKLTADYGMRPALAEAMVQTAAELRAWCCPLLSELASGQVVWLVHGTHRSRRTDPRLFTPVVLTLLTPEEHNLDLNHRGEFKKVKMAQLERITAEAWRQDGVLTTLDIQWLLSLSPGLARELLESYQEQFGILLPTAGTVLDMGRSLTHKTIVIEMFLQGQTAHQIARRIFHTEEAVDAYIKVFDRVLILKYFGMPENLMQRVTGHSIALLKEHLALAEKHFPTKEALMEYLGQRNISLDMTG